ncbi:MAG: outer membrane lipoprotein-sorting protein [Akkermansiaceae bacterium]|nr:outer membrane lipoprotein-sorting protein [Akkermansiaceae bacterium]
MKHTFWMAPLVALGMASALAQEEAQPDPERIMERARLGAVLAKLDEGLEGQLRQGRKRVPVALFLKGEDIQFQFSENKQPWQIFHMRLGEEDFKLRTIKDGKTFFFDKKRLVEPIASTDLTYEDLALRFLYWPNPELLGIEEVSGQECYRLRIQKPEGAEGRYETVEVWAHVKFGAFMRIRGYNEDGTLIKEFQVEDVMRIDKDTWTLEKMQVSTHDPKTGRRLSITELTFDRPNKPKPRGLR